MLLNAKGDTFLISDKNGIKNGWVNLPSYVDKIYTAHIDSDPHITTNNITLNGIKSACITSFYKDWTINLPDAQFVEIETPNKANGIFPTINVIRKDAVVYLSKNAVFNFQYPRNKMPGVQNSPTLEIEKVKFASAPKEEYDDLYFLPEENHLVGEYGKTERQKITIPKTIRRNGKDYPVKSWGRNMIQSETITEITIEANPGEVEYHSEAFDRVQGVGFLRAYIKGGAGVYKLIEYNWVKQ